MAIDFDGEMTEIAGKLKQVVGYLDCEKIIVNNIRKQLQNGNNDENIILYLKKLSACFDKTVETNKHDANCTNYRFASGFVDTLLRRPYWKSWMNTFET